MRFKAFQDYWEFAVINGRLFVATGIAIVALFALQFHTSSQKKECMGVVDLKETTIAFDTSVVVKNIFVLPGQRVKKGQALLEVKPVETTMKMLELQTQLDQLVTEKQIQDSLISTLGRNSGTSPADLQIEGLKKQLHEMQQSMDEAIRYAMTDGVVGSVNFRISEQVAPFAPILTLNTSNPNLVYGFIHEDRLSDFQNGESLQVQSLSSRLKTSAGRVVSLGNRITEFPERLTGGNPNVRFWGREIVVSLPENNDFLPGEKVRLTADSQISTIGSLFRLVEALAGVPHKDQPKVISYNLPFEASGVQFIEGSEETELLVVSDDNDIQSHSPFWKIDLNSKADKNHFSIFASMELSEKEDLESISFDGERYYAMGSMTSNKKGSRLVIFKYIEGRAQIESILPFRHHLLKALIEIPMLSSVVNHIYEDLEIEGASISDGKAILALKKPVLEDGSSLLIEITNFSEFIESQGQTELKASIVAPLYLNSKSCHGVSKVTDLAIVDSGILLLTNCKQDDISQLWLFRTGVPVSYPTLLETWEIPKLEGLVVSSDQATVFMTDDNGKKGASTIFKAQLPDYR